MPRQSITLIASLAVLAFAALVMAANGGSAEDAQPQGGAVQHLTLRPSDFISVDPACPAKTGAFQDTFGFIQGNQTGECASWIANIHVPDGATLTALKVAYRDDAAQGNLFVAIKERTLFAAGGVNTALSGQLPDPGNSEDSTATLLGNVPVDNANSHYQFAFSVDTPDFAFIAAVISYTAPGVGGLQGDVDCDGSVGSRDQQAILRNVLAQAALSQTEPCRDIGS